jgi:hypothetical protein
MKKRPIKNVAASVRDRLATIQRRSGRDYQGLMVQYAFDFWFLAHRFAFDGEVLTSFITGTVARRQTSLPAVLPRGLSAEYSSDPARIAAWDAFWRKTGTDDEKPSLETVVQFIAPFLAPPLHAASKGEVFKQTWPPGGPWSRVRRG